MTAMFVADCPCGLPAVWVTTVEGTPVRLVVDVRCPACDTADLDQRAEAAA